MARMFETEFDYREEIYKATVIISGSDDDKTVSVQVPLELQEILQERKIVVEHYNTSQKPVIGTAKDPALLRSILTAVQKHEDAEVPAGNLWS